MRFIVYVYIYHIYTCIRLSLLIHGLINTRFACTGYINQWFEYMIGPPANSR